MYSPPLSILKTFITCSDCLFTKVFHFLNLANTSFLALKHIHPNLGSAGTFICREWSPSLFSLDKSFACQWMHIVLHYLHIYTTSHTLKCFHAICIEMSQPLVPKFHKMWGFVGMRQRTCFGPCRPIFNYNKQPRNNRGRLKRWFWYHLGVIDKVY